MPQETRALQEFLDTHQYAKNGILRYERIFGHTFVSTGGKETTDHFLKKLDLKPGSRVLDVGCGIGGSAFVMDKEYGAVVRGVDLSTNMIGLALQRQKEVGSKNTSFHVEDIITAQYPENEFDLIYSRDTILHIEDKISLYTNLYRWLKPGGRLFVTDYSCRGHDHSEEFVKYVMQREYTLLSPAQYKKVVEQAGFVDVVVEDQRDMFLDILKRERARVVAIKDQYIKDFSEKDYNDIVNGWQEKIERVTEGSQVWVSISARK